MAERHAIAAVLSRNPRSIAVVDRYVGGLGTGWMQRCGDSVTPAWPGRDAGLPSVRQADVTENPRYRIENGEPCVDIRITSIEQLFDNRDSAPLGPVATARQPGSS